MQFERILSFVILCLVFIISILNYRTIKAPPLKNLGKLFLLYWIVNTIIGVMMFITLRDWNWNSLTFLLLYVNIFAICYNSASINRPVKFQSFQHNLRNSKILRNLIFCTVGSGFGYVYYELTSNGFGMATLTSTEGLMAAGYYFTDGRYGGSTEIQVPLIGQILLMINYSGFCLAGFCYKLGLQKKYLCFLQFVPMIISTVTTTAKTLLVSGLLLWITGYIIGNIVAEYKNSNTRQLSIKKIILPVIVVFTFFYISFVVRYQTNDQLDIINRLFVYAFGHVPCYDDWFAKFDANLFGYSFGQQSAQMFFGPIMPVNLSHRYVVPYLNTPYGWTNVNTMFAYYLMDYGYVGSIIYSAVWGWLAGISHTAIIKRGSVIGYAFLALSIYLILYSFLISALKYTSIVGSFVLFGGYIHLLKKQKIYSYA